MIQVINKREKVLKYHPDAIPVNVGCKSGDYFNIKDGIHVLGQGKTKKSAWAAAYKHVYSD